MFDYVANQIKLSPVQQNTGATKQVEFFSCTNEWMVAMVTICNVVSLLYRKSSDVQKLFTSDTNNVPASKCKVVYS